MEIADVNCGEIVDVGGVVYMVDYFCRDGPEPCETLAVHSRG